MIQSLCNSFRAECLQGLHNFAVGGDMFKIALYEDDVLLGPLTERYSAEGESHGRGYTSGGQALRNVTPSMIGPIMYMSFETPIVWTGSFLARGALIYNASKDNRAVAVLDFGKVNRILNGTFKIHLPIEEYLQSSRELRSIGALIKSA